MVNDILDLSRIETGNIELSFEPIDVHGVIANCVELTKPLAANRGIHISLPTRAETVYALADLTRLRQILVNLLSNAIKYNRDQGQVNINLDASDQEIVVSIADTGMGLNSKQLEKMFQPFNRLGAEKGKTDGTGLGLVIVKQLIEKMGGQIAVSSEVGAGSVFSIHLKKCAAPESVKTERRATPREPHESNLASKPHSVLYIEDNAVNIQVVEATLARNPNIALSIAMDGHTGFAEINKLRPDLVLLDINLPGIDGFEVLEIVRKHQDIRDIPCIAITANAMAGEMERAKKAGFVDYITKPFDVNILLAKVNQILESSSRKVSSGQPAE